MAEETRLGWRPISEAPQTQTVLGGWYHYQWTWVWDKCRYDPHDGRWTGIRGGEPTHYLPLPEPPQRPARAVGEASEPGLPDTAMFVPKRACEGAPMVDGRCPHPQCRATSVDDCKLTRTVAPGATVDWDGDEVNPPLPVD